MLGKKTIYKSQRPGQGKDLQTFSNPSQTGWTQLCIMPDRDLSKPFCKRKIKDSPLETTAATSSGNTAGATDLLLELCKFFLLFLFPADPLLLSLSLLFFVSQSLLLLLLPELLLPSCFFLSCSPGHFFFSDSRVSKVQITGYLFL